MKKSLPRLLFGIACLLAFLGHAGKFWQIPFITLLDNYFYDVRVRMFMPNKVDDRIAIVDIDEKSLAEIGQWPWPRDRVAQLVRQLTDDYQVAVIGFDIVFAEPDGSSGLRVLEELGRGDLRREAGYQKALQKLKAQLDYDRLLAAALRDRPVVLGFYFSGRDDAHKGGVLPPPAFPAGSFAAYPEQFISWKGYGGNLPVLQEAAASAGHFNPLVDFDGNARRVPLLVEYGGAYYPALSLSMVRTLLGETTLEPGAPDPAAPIEWLDIATARGALRIPVDGDAAVLVPYRGPERSFSYVSAADVLKGRTAPEQLRGRIVLVGTTAPGLNDLRTTPVGSAYPGVEIHANLIAGILDGDIKEKPAYIIAADLLGILVAGGLLTIALPLLSPLRGTALATATLLAALGINLLAWEAGNTVLPFASTALAIILIYGFNMAWGFFAETRIKRQFTELFGQYVPPELVDEMAKNPENYSMEGRNEELTVLFSDIRSFTTISEGLDPKELSRLMNEYLGAMTDVIRGRRGTLDKYIGDAIMAFWGAPVADTEHARNAVLTALAMQEALTGLEAPFRARGWPPLRIGIGVNTGTMTVGDMGSRVRKAYTVMGDAVNLGSRLEGISKEYGVGIVVGETTRRRCEGIAFRELDRVRVKGKAEPVAIYEPLGPEATLSAETRAELDAWQQALALYRGQRWDEAEAALLSLLQRAPDRRLYALYLERISRLREEPPADGDWDGVTTFKTK